MLSSTNMLEDEVRLVLTTINDATDMGIWKRTLKTKTGLHDKTLVSCLKELEGRRLIKTVRGVKVRRPVPIKPFSIKSEAVPDAQAVHGVRYSAVDRAHWRTVVYR